MMDYRDRMKFCDAPLTSNNYFSGSNDMDVVFGGKRLWKYVLKSKDEAASETASDTEHIATEGQHAVVFTCEDNLECQKRDLALSCILTSN